MSNAGSTAATWLRRTWRAWQILSPDRRRAAVAAMALFLTLFLPWYSQTVVATSTVVKIPHVTPLAPQNVSGWGAFTWVQALVLVGSLAVLTLLFRSAEGRGIPLPSGDGWAITVIGGFVSLLVIWSMFDKPGVAGHGQFALSTGLDWGIFVALIVAAVLTSTGTRIRGSLAAAATGGTGSPGGGDGDAGHGSGGGGGSRRAASATRMSAGEAAGSARRPRHRSSWRPADSPAWSEPTEQAPTDSERLPATYRQKPGQSATGRRPGAEAPPTSPPADQLTIPLDPNAGS